MNKERFQNPTYGDTVNLRLFSYNSNNLADFESIEKVDIYHLDPQEISETNTDGRRLVESFSGATVVLEDTGTHLLTVDLEKDKYVIGEYIDVWTVSPDIENPSQTVSQSFSIYPSLWYTTPTPVVYDFQFFFQPNKMRQGSKQFLIIEIRPNVPRGSDLDAYYQNLAIVSDLKISIEQRCGECLPQECDLRLIVDNESVDYREKKYGYYRIDTEDWECGIYDVWFRLDFGENRYISERQQLQIYN